VPVWIVFTLLLVLSFVAIVAVLRPTQPEKDLQRHLKSIGGLYDVDLDGTTILRQETLSSLPWLDGLLAKVPFSYRLRLFISQAGSKYSVANLLLGSLAMAGIAARAVAWQVSNLPIAILAGIGAGSLPYLYFGVKRMARLRRFDTLLPEAIDLMSRALKAGQGVGSAIEMVAEEIPEPVKSEFRTVFEEQTLGLPLRETVLNLAHRVPLEDVQVLVTAILVQMETGGNLAEILDKTSAVMRERIRLRGQLRIYTAQARVTGFILCILPFFVFLVLNLINPNYEKLLLTDPLGIKLVYTGLTMMVIGILIIRKIIKIKV
jgi:tight adherence protein B